MGILGGGGSVGAPGGLLGGAGGSSTGAPGGGPLGAMGMDFGLYKMPVIGSFFQDPNETFKQQQFHQMGRAYSAYRPEAAQARMNALANRLSAYQGANDALSAMSGRPGYNAGAYLANNPMGPSMMQQGASKGADKVPDNSMFGSQGLLGGLLDGGGIGGILGGGGGMGGGIL
jgi:hypothetical protein